MEIISWSSNSIVIAPGFWFLSLVFPLIVGWNVAIIRAVFRSSDREPERSSNP